MTLPKKRIAVIGGGISGILCIATLKKEGLEPVCFEKTDQPGGTWCYREEAIEGLGSIMPTTCINQSKEMGALSNFPPGKEYNNYMRHGELYQYFMEYVKVHDVWRHIRLNTEVVHVKKADDYEETGRWIVSVKDFTTGNESSDVYDGVLVCVGHLNRPKFAQYPGQEKFKGKIIHAHSLKEVNEYKGKVVVIIGMGCSALDAAVDICRVAKQVYLSTRSGAYVVTRLGPQGYPIDYVLFRRFITMFLDILPTYVCSWVIQTLFLDSKFNHKLYTVQPKQHMLAKDPVVNDHIGSKLHSGAVVQKGDIISFTENRVIFDGDDDVTETDAVIMATGYTWGFPFLEEGVVIKEKDKINLYKFIFPPQMTHSTIGIIGFFLPFGPGFPPIELQVRYAARILAGKAELPSEDEMMTDIENRYKLNSCRYDRGEKMSIHVDFTQFMDEMASVIGCKPNLFRLFFTDIRLWCKLVFGPCVSYQYRLQGPNSWEGARDAIMTVEDRLHWPLRKQEESRTGYMRFLFDVFVNVLIKVFFL